MLNRIRGDLRRTEAHQQRVPAPASGHHATDTHLACAAGGTSTNHEGHCAFDAHEVAAFVGDDGAHEQAEAQTATSPVIAEIRQLWRLRQAWHRAEKSLTLQAKARCRSWTAGDKAEANKLFDQAASGAPVDPWLTVALMPFLQGIEQFRSQRRPFENRLATLAKSLPVWPAVQAMKGFGALNLAAVVGEAGDVGNYRNPSCLWKRMGLAVINGERQRKIADAELALIHGYSPRRRALAFVLGDCLIKASGHYKHIYDARKVQELSRDGMTKIWAHRRAARKMTKDALRDLWVAWRGSATPPLKPKQRMQGPANA